MKVFLYCSYEGSPSGFDIGFVIDVKKPFLFMKKDLSESLTKTLFITGGIQKAYGRISENKWLLLFKDIDDYKNLALEFDDYEEYRAFTGLIKAEREGLATAIEKILCPDKSIRDFAYKLNKSEYEDFLSQLKDSQQSESAEDGRERLFLECRSSITERELSESLNLYAEGFEKVCEKAEESCILWLYDEKKTEKLLKRRSGLRKLRKSLLLIKYLNFS